MNLFNDTDISTSTNKDTCLVPMNFFQVVARGCVPSGLNRADVFEIFFKCVKVCEVIYMIYFGDIYIFCLVKLFSFHEKYFL